jgi:uncharacterized membrane protein YkoI
MKSAERPQGCQRFVMGSLQGSFMRHIFSFIFISILLVLLPGSAWADDESSEHENADEVYKGTQSGEILPLRDILVAVRKMFEGEVIETKFERLGGVPVYEIYILDKNGNRIELYVNARTGGLIEKEEDD